MSLSIELHFAYSFAFQEVAINALLFAINLLRPFHLIPSHLLVPPSLLVPVH